jgi:predicted small metal-binding protein
MYTFACKDMEMDCGFVTSGETVEEVKNKAMAHAQKAHADVLKNMSTPAQMAKMEEMVLHAIK